MPIVKNTELKKNRNLKFSSVNTFDSFSKIGSRKGELYPMMPKDSRN